MSTSFPLVQSPKQMTLTVADLPFSCPPPKATAWNLHPRVVLPISLRHPKHTCPYCGTHYILDTTGQ